MDTLKTDSLISLLWEKPLEILRNACMYLCLCGYVCVHACMCTCVYVFMYACTHIVYEHETEWVSICLFIVGLFQRSHSEIMILGGSDELVLRGTKRFTDILFTGWGQYIFL